MKIAVVGTGYVGLVTGVTFTHHGNEVACIDVDPSRVEAIRQARSPIYEPGLEEMMRKALKKKLLSAHTDYTAAMKDARVVFVSVPTPMDDEGAMDVSFVRSAGAEIGRQIRGRKDFPVLVMKSTVITGTTMGPFREEVEKTSGMKAGVGFGLCMNPEFLREGQAMDDALRPDRIVVGELNKKSGDAVWEIYKPWDCAKMRTDIGTAETIKYVSNSFLATKIAFSNEMALICETLGVDVYEVMKGAGLDKRISPHFLNAGCGYGGSCFPKDVSALHYAAKERGVPTHVLDAVMAQNEVQPLHVVDIASKAVRGLRGKRVAVLGLAFKPDTDDVRYSRAVPIIKAMVAEGATVIGYDPQGAENFKKFGLDMEYAGTLKEALNGAELAIVQSDWKEFRDMSPKDFAKHMKDPVVVDGRRTWDPAVFDGSGVRYFGIGWKISP